VAGSDHLAADIADRDSRQRRSCDAQEVKFEDLGAQRTLISRFIVHAPRAKLVKMEA